MAGTIRSRSVTRICSISSVIDPVTSTRKSTSAVAMRARNWASTNFGGSSGGSSTHTSGTGGGTKASTPRMSGGTNMSASGPLSTSGTLRPVLAPQPAINPTMAIASAPVPLL